LEEKNLLKAMILAAGVGSRLDPLTRTVPKPMVPVVNVPVMEHIVRLLAKHGFNDIIANTHYLADHIEDYFASHEIEGVTMTFNREAELLGTAGGLKRVQDQRNFFDSEPFLVVGGDDLTDIDLSKMLEFHRSNGALATIALTSVEDPSQFGVVVLNGDKIERFVEKPKPGTAPSNMVNMGVYLFDPKILDYIPSGEFWDFGKNVFPEILEKGETFCGYESKDYWRDVGNLREYRDVQSDFFDDLVVLHTGETHVANGVHLGRDVQIDPTAQIEAPCLIGAGSVVGANAKISSHSVIGQNVKIGANATIEKSILWDGAEVGEGTLVSGTVLGYDSKVESNAGVFGAVIVPAAKK
jgi:mannose-1-phosphate guanylyltransferase